MYLALCLQQGWISTSHRTVKGRERLSLTRERCRLEIRALCEIMAPEYVIEAFICLQLILMSCGFKRIIGRV